MAGVDAYEEVTAGAKKKGRKEANQQRCQQVLRCPKGGSAHLMAGQLGAGSSAVAGLRGDLGSLDTAAPESADSADGGACGFIGHPS